MFDGTLSKVFLNNFYDLNRGWMNDLPSCHFHGHDQILEFLREIFLKGFRMCQGCLCALKYAKMAD